MTITQAVAARLNAILKSRKMLKKDFKELPGINGQSINNIFRTSGTPSISMTTLFKICNALNMPVQEFLNDPLFDSANIEL